MTAAGQRRRRRGASKLSYYDFKYINTRTYIHTHAPTTVSEAALPRSACAMRPTGCSPPSSSPTV